MRAEGGLRQVEGDLGARKTARFGQGNKYAEQAEVDIIEASHETFYIDISR
jgi:hypothetical protein